jgi:hypothetical protein
MYVHNCKLIPVPDKPDMIDVVGPCFVTKRPYTVRVAADCLQAYINGEGKVQDLFPELSKDQREFLISGTSPEGWNKIFPPNEKEEDSLTDEQMKIMEAKVR